MNKDKIEWNLKACIVVDSKFGPGWGSRQLGGVGHCPSSWSSCRIWFWWFQWLSFPSIPSLTSLLLRFPKQYCVHSWPHALEYIPLLTSLPTTARLCSVSRTFSVLLGSPVYTPSQSLQRTWYTMPFFFSSGMCNFTCNSTCFKVLVWWRHCRCWGEYIYTL